MHRTMIERPGGPRRGRSASAAALALCVLAGPALRPGSASLQAQIPPEILQAMERGGAWIALPIEAGVGSFQSESVPTFGIRLQGHLRIWEEHTGSWHVAVRDLARDADRAVLERLMTPGERVDFDYRTGMLGQVRIDVRWSEARDTTLRVWVGVGPTPAADDGADGVRSGALRARKRGRSPVRDRPRLPRRSASPTRAISPRSSWSRPWA